MKVNVKAARRAQTEKRINQQDTEAIEFGMALGCIYCREKREFGKGRMNRLIRGTYEELVDRFMMYRESEEETFSPDNLPTLYMGLRVQMKGLDVDVEAIEDEFGFPEVSSSWDRKRLVIRRERRQTLLNREVLVRCYWYGMMLHLWHEYNWGTQRLTNFYRYCREQYRAVYLPYLGFTPEQDTKIDHTVKATIARIKEMGVSF